MDDSLRTRDIVKGTVTFGSSCYTFDNEINHWSRAKDQCKATNGGTLAFNITSEINALLIGFAKANNIVSMNWIGARTDRLVGKYMITHTICTMDRQCGDET